MVKIELCFLTETSMTNNMMNQQPERKVTAIDGLVVNFEEGMQLVK